MASYCQCVIVNLRMKKNEVRTTRKGSELPMDFIFGCEQSRKRSQIEQVNVKAMYIGCGVARRQSNGLKRREKYSHCWTICWFLHSQDAGHL